MPSDTTNRQEDINPSPPLSDLLAHRLRLFLIPRGQIVLDDLVRRDPRQVVGIRLLWVPQQKHKVVGGGVVLLDEGASDLARATGDEHRLDSIGGWFGKGGEGFKDREGEHGECGEHGHGRHGHSGLEKERERE